MSRRAAGAVAVASLAPKASARDPAAARHAVAEVTAPAAELPRGKRLPFGWGAAAVGAGPVRLRFPDWPAGRAASDLRVSVALETRDSRRVEVVAAGRVVGAFEVRFACPFQVYSAPLDAAAWAVARRDGLSLRVANGAAPLWILTSGDGLPAALRPHALIPGTAEPFAEFQTRFGSLASVQPFGWMAGCVLDGLLDWAARPGRGHFAGVARQQLDLFTPRGKLVYEGPRGTPADGAVTGIEATLPFAALARRDPRDPLLDLATRFWDARRGAGGVVRDAEAVTSEGSYTVGYPMAVIGRARKSDALERSALAQVRERHAMLFDGKAFWRTRADDGKRGDRNWSRGVAWQLLGSARTLAVLRHRPDTQGAVDDLRRLADWVVASQRPDGLWGVITDEPKLTADSAGSAGLAAGLAIGVGAGFLGDAAGKSADRALAALKTQLTPDGFLAGVSQANKGGTALQRGDYRVIYQMGMGLLAQLAAARD